MGRGEQTRQTILDHATGLASQLGLGGMTIGRLADDLELSKSGLFAHFRSKEALQLDVLQHAEERFTEVVIRPALKAPRGEPRVRALFEGWLGWAQASPLPGGCLFVAAATELDDRPGPLRDRLVRSQRDWLEVIANVFRTGVNEGHFRRDADPEQFAHDLHGVMLAFHHATRLMRDPQAGDRAQRGFETLIGAVRRKKH